MMILMKLLVFLPGAVLAGPCSDLCKRDGPQLCPGSSYARRNGRCHGYYFKAPEPSEEYCYHNSKTRHVCPSTDRPVMVEDAVRLLSQSVENAPTPESDSLDVVSSLAPIIEEVDRSLRSYEYRSLIAAEAATAEFLQGKSLPELAALWRENELNERIFSGSLKLTDFFVKVLDRLGFHPDQEFWTLSGFCDAARANAHQIYRDIVERSADVWEKACPDLFEQLVGLKKFGVVSRILRQAHRTTTWIDEFRTSRSHAWERAVPMLIQLAPSLIHLGDDEEYRGFHFDKKKFNELNYRGNLKDWISTVSEQAAKRGLFDVDGSGVIGLPCVGCKRAMEEFNAFGRLLAVSFMHSGPTALVFSEAFQSAFMHKDTSNLAMREVRAGFDAEVSPEVFTAFTQEELFAMLSGVRVEFDPETFLSLCLIQNSSWRDTDSVQKDMFEAAVRIMPAGQLRKIFRMATGLKTIPFTGFEQHPKLLDVLVGQSEMKYHAFYNELNVQVQPSVDRMVEALDAFVERIEKFRNL